MNQSGSGHTDTGASKRMEALSDGIFAIAATLLVLEIRVPELNDPSMPKMTDALLAIVPSLVAFIFSFLNILIFWMNHDSVGKVIDRFDLKLTCLNIVFLLFISLVPFTTAFVSKYPFNFISITTYGSLFFLTSLIASAMYYHIAFKSGLMHHKITIKSRIRIWKRIRSGPIFFALAIMLGWVNVYIPIIIYIMIPFLFLIMPKMEFDE